MSCGKTVTAASRAGDTGIEPCFLSFTWKGALETHSLLLLSLLLLLLLLLLYDDDDDDDDDYHIIIIIIIIIEIIMMIIVIAKTLRLAEDRDCWRKIIKTSVVPLQPPSG